MSFIGVGIGYLVNIKWMVITWYTILFSILSGITLKMYCCFVEYNKLSVMQTCVRILSNILNMYVQVCAK